MNTEQKVILIILDGFGFGLNPKTDAIQNANKPFIDKLFAENKWTKLTTSGEDVGLPEGQMGNSEVGHMNIGAGRIVWQDITRINRSIRLGEFFNIPAFISAIENAKKNKSAIHLVGLLSDGGVHSMNTHLYALLELAKQHNFQKVFIHALLDGRDTPPDSGIVYLKELQSKIQEIGVGKIATVMGRYYGMDRDNRWERTELAYRALTEGMGQQCSDPIAAVAESYKNSVTDEFIKPIVCLNDGKPVGSVLQNDSFIFFNFRSDRTRQLTRAFIMDDFDKFNREKLNLYFTTMTHYHDDFKVPIAFAPISLTNTMGEILSNRGLKQLRIAETEKYAHVTFFFNGGREEVFKGEDRILVPSPKEVATYDLKPQMSAYEVTDKLIEAIETDKYDFILVNYANCDMVGHSGIMQAAIKAVEAVDKCLSRVVPVAQKHGFIPLITSDHGNADKMAEDSGEPFTAHTLNLVPFIVVQNPAPEKLKENGILADISPTILKLMGMSQPKEMDGSSLI
ncbi:MAG: 2,3-bisphosphoglycerate-independent phosphoglycerate mutase [Bacteroidota bacterium]|nr:2,3-bisphosphoglycerate-independent phosphoglycerate mutase [Bacteroidota bacterium]